MRSGHNADGHWNGTVASCCYLFPSSIPRHQRMDARAPAAALCAWFYVAAAAWNGRPACECKNCSPPAVAAGRANLSTGRGGGKRGTEGGDDVVAGVVDVGAATASDVAPGGSRSGNSPRLSISPMHTQ